MQHCRNLTLLRVQREEVEESEIIFSTLMGEDVENRRNR